jgi:short-subunit dehydrogenase
MTSLSGFQGTALVATYAATKAFNLVLAEGLWDELRSRGVDVLACAAGPISTPNYIASEPTTKRLSPPALSPEQVAVETIDALAAGRCPLVVPGLAYRLSSYFVQRLLPRRVAVRFLGANLRAMYPRFS